MSTGPPRLLARIEPWGCPVHVRNIALFKMPRPVQLPIPRTWGGAREGAGRPVIEGRRRPTPHRARPDHKPAHPVHVTMRGRAGLAPLSAGIPGGSLGAGCCKLRGIPDHSLLGPERPPACHRRGARQGGAGGWAARPCHPRRTRGESRLGPHGAAVGRPLPRAPSRQSSRGAQLHSLRVVQLPEASPRGRASD
jgi:hypothetical protein